MKTPNEFTFNVEITVAVARDTVEIWMTVLKLSSVLIDFSILLPTLMGVCETVTDVFVVTDKPFLHF